MPPDSRHATRPPVADRQAAGAGLLAEEVERVVRSASRRGSSAPGSSRSTRQPLRFLDPPADLALDLRRRQRKPLVGAARGHAERRAGRTVAEVARGSRCAIASKSSGARPAREKFAMPNTSRRRSRTASQSRVGTEHDLDPAHQHAHVARRRDPTSPRGGCGPAARRTTGRFLPLSAISW